MTPRPLSFLRFALILQLLHLLYSTPARAQYTLMENHPGFWVEWLQRADSTINDVTLGDVDNDGAPDLFVRDGSSLELWRNNGRGEFAPDPDPVSAFGLYSFLASDVDGDARLDLIASAPSGGIAFLKGLGGGRFAPPVTSATGTTYAKLVEMDINGDGIMEVVAGVARPATGLHVLARDGNQFTVTARLIPTAQVIQLCVADLNHDGRQDLVAGTAGSPWGHLVMFLNDGQTLEDIVAFPSPREFFSIIPIDFDGDGDVDLLIEGYSSVVLLRGNGTGRDWGWVEIPGDFGSYGIAVQVADLDQDNDPELMIAWRNSPGVFLDSFHPRTDPTLSNGSRLPYTHAFGYSALPPDDIKVADLNRDGLPDLVLLSTYGPSIPRPYDSGRGMIGVVLNHNGVPGGIHLPPADVPASSIAAARFHPSRPAEIVLAGPAGLFLTAARGDGTLAPSRRIGDGGTVRVADLNHDGRDDLIVGVDGSTEVRLTRPGGPGPVVARFQGRVIDVGDLDHDRRPDLLVRRGGALDIVWAGPGSRFDRISQTEIFLSQSFQALVGDADGDGRNELIECRLHPPARDQDQGEVPDTISAYRCSPRDPVRLEHRSVLPRIIPNDDVYEVVAKASDLDGTPGDEIVVLTGVSGNGSSRLRVLRAIGDGGYELGSDAPIGGEGPAGPWLADLDGDGDLDAACVANISGQDGGNLHVRWNDGHGNLTGVWSRRIPRTWLRELAVADFDGNGAADLAILTPRLFDSNTPLIALLFGRRDEVSARVPTVEFAGTRIASPIPRLEIGEIVPNPARDQFTIRWAGRSDEPATLELHDVAGRRVRSAQLSVAQPGEREARFESLGDLPAGLYWIRLRQGHLTATKRVALIR